MRFFSKLIYPIIFIFIISCSKSKIEERSVLTQNSLELQVIEVYQEGIKAYEEGDVLFAAKKFNEAELLFPQSIWAPKSALMAAYVYYTQDYYGDSIAELERFIRVYPNHENLAYAYYLLATCYYEQVVDEQKDLKSMSDSKKTFEFIIRNYPNTDYAVDAEFKIDLLNDILASKEMYIAKYYLEKKKWIPAINRYRDVVDNYQTTIYAEEALHRLVEIYYSLGLKDEAQKYAKVLGYNYQSSKWYEKSYKLFNKNYKIDRNEKNKKDKFILKKFKSLFD
jgi:outer membrane protein assembly factor BamD